MGSLWLCLPGLLSCCLCLVGVEAVIDEAVQGQNQQEAGSLDTVSILESRANETVWSGIKDGQPASELSNSGLHEKSELLSERETEDSASHLSTETCAKRLWTQLTDMVHANLYSYSPMCEEVKKTGGVPSVTAGHAPIEIFGYPFFDMRSTRVLLEPRISLSSVNGFKQPIKVGVHDYIISGSLGQIKAFLSCFEDYEVISSAVGQDGYWSSAPGHSNVVLQLQNTVNGSAGPLELSERLCELGASKLEKVATDLKGRSTTSLANALNTALDTAQSLQDLGPDLWDSFRQCSSLKDAVKVLWNYIQGTVRGVRLEEKKGWVDSKTVNLAENLILKISSYGQPCHGVRATLVMPVHTTTLREILGTLPAVYGLQSDKLDKQ